MKKWVTVIIAICTCLSLTGCMGLVSDVTLNNDASGAVTIKMGFSEMAMEFINSIDPEGANNLLVNDSGEETEMVEFKQNGKKYYGMINTFNFSNIEEFNTKIDEAKNNEEIDSGMLKLEKNADGTFLLTFSITSETANTTDSEQTMASLDISEEEIAVLMKDMVMSLTFNMPGKVTQIEGDGEGITIKNNVIKIDLLKLNVPTEQKVIKKYSFTTQKIESPIANETNNLRFSDVPETLWSYNAINTLAEGGLVSGVGDGRFSPERGMKISEFCQVLANATGLESGADESGYWAAKAILSCVNRGYIYSHGEINMENYDQIITREEAISAMQIASGRVAIAGSNITIENIPDGDQISEQYKQTVVEAYNSGITTGVNEELKFSPKNKLTRGQVCQLFLNVDWTTPITR